jgi:hypothetical protein
MTRPDGIPDPRAENAPVRLDDEQEDTARSRVTVEELDAWWRHRRLSVEVAYNPLELPEIPPERLAELRRRRDEILAVIRQQGGISDGGK